MNVFTREFWAATAERGIRTFAQAAAALLAGDGLGILDIDWISVLSVAGLATIVSVLMSVASSPIGTPGPALVATEAIGVRSAEAEALETHAPVYDDHADAGEDDGEPAPGVEMSDEEASEPITDDTQVAPVAVDQAVESYAPEH